LPRQDRLDTFASTAQQSEFWPRKPVDVRPDQRDRERFRVPCHSDGLLMSFVLQPWQVFFVTLAAWVSHRPGRERPVWHSEPSTATPPSCIGPAASATPLACCGEAQGVREGETPSRPWPAPRHMGQNTRQPHATRGASAAVTRSAHRPALPGRRGNGPSASPNRLTRPSSRVYPGGVPHLAERCHKICQITHLGYCIL
jgi:hypothetical protein